MRIAAILAVAAAYGMFVDALTQVESGLRGLAADDENQSAVVPSVFFLADGASCNWGSGLSCNLDSNTNNLHLGGDKCHINVPVPTDNYVSDRRVNKYDSGGLASDKPYIEVTATLGSNPAQTTGKVTWLSYLTQPTTAQSAITFNTPGLYNMLITAWDYDRQDTCAGCVAILDTFRPKFAGSCPIGPSPNSQTLTTTSIASRNNYESSYKSAVANRVNNAGGAGDCSDETHTAKNFYETEADFGGNCFDNAALAYNIAKLKTNPFPGDLQTGSVGLEKKLNDLSVWCCHKSVTLKEKYIAYSCPSATPDPVCVGGSDNSCGLDQCLKLTGNDIATASIVINDNVQKASQGVIDAVQNAPANADPSKNVYYSLPCTKFDATDPQCQYSAKLSDLIHVTSEAFVPAFPAGTENVENFVFWRYNLDGGVWYTWDPHNDSPLAFTHPGTTVNIEAWTASGRIGDALYFNVNLYVHSSLTCANFDAMWSGVGVEVNDGGTYCAVPQSEFTVFKWDYDYTKVLPHDAGTVTGTYIGAKCTIMVKESASDAVDTTPATLFDSSDQTISKNFAVELVHDPHTAQKTAGMIKCTFTRSSHDNSILIADDTTDPNTLTCSHNFYVTDCEAPVIEPGVDQNSICEDQCAGKPDPGIHEACGGTVVRSNLATTTISTADASCCTACTSPLSCTALGATTIKRCEVTTTPLYLAELAATELAAAEEKVFSSESITALLGATAMVAVVALVVVKRRADAAAAARESEDAYYPLLE